MSLATVVEALLTAGGTAEQIVSVVKAVEAQRAAQEEAAAEAKRESDRVRQRKSRAERKAKTECHTMSHDVTDVTVTTPSPKEGFPDPSKNTPLTPFRSSEGKSPLPNESSDAGASDSDGGAKPKSNRSIAKPVYTIDFERFWRDYPLTVGKKEAYEVWRRLCAEDRAAAIDGLVGYKADLASKPDPKILHGCRFLKYRRFDDYLTQTGPMRMMDVAVDTPMFQNFAYRYRREFNKEPESDGVTGRLPAEWVEHFNAVMERKA